jgi:hypothetical protein
MTTHTTVFPRRGGQRAHADPLIAEARARGRRRRRRLAIAFVLVTFVVGFSVDRWAVPSHAGVGARVLPNPCTLLTRSQVSGVVGGKVESSSFSRSYGELTCTWSSPPLGYMRDHQTFRLSLFHATKAELKTIARKSIPPLSPVSGVGAPAYGWENGGGEIEAWKRGTIVDVQGALVQVYPHEAIALLRRVLAQL